MAWSGLKSNTLLHLSRYVLPPVTLYSSFIVTTSDTFSRNSYKPNRKVIVRITNQAKSLGYSAIPVKKKKYYDLYAQYNVYKKDNLGFAFFYYSKEKLYTLYLGDATIDKTIEESMRQRSGGRK